MGSFEPRASRAVKPTARPPRAVAATTAGSTNGNVHRVIHPLR